MRIRAFVFGAVILCAVMTSVSAAKETAGPLARAEILTRLAAGEASAALAAELPQRGIRFEPSEENLQSLRAAGADEALLAAVRAARRVPASDTPAAKLASQARESAAAGDFDAAVAAYRDALRLNPDDGATRVLYAQALRAKGETAQALEELKLATLLAPNDLSARSAYLRLKREMDSPGGAQAAAPRAKRVYTSDDLKAGDASSPLAAEIAAVVESAAASESPAKADSNPEPKAETPGAAEKAKCIEALRGPDAGSAEAACRDYASRASDDADAHYYACLAMRQNAHAGNAVDECKAAASLRPDDPRLHTSLGETYLAKVDPSSAIPAFRRALQLNPDYAAAHFGLGRAYLARQDRKLALEHYQKAHTLNPSLPNLHVEYCTLLDETGKMPLGSNMLPAGWQDVYKTCRFVRYNY